MRLLIITQAVDSNDTYLGFFVRWIEELSKRCATTEVLCLKLGHHTLPHSIRVQSLGKERGVSKWRYVFNFYSHIWERRSAYDVVFVHMNQEYVLLGALVWRLMGKRVYLWRNHYAGGFLTRIAVALSHGVFCTSQSSYTARFRKTHLMPVGVDLAALEQTGNVRTRDSVLFFGRFAPSKHPDVFVDALKILSDRKISFSASLVGSALPNDAMFASTVRARAIQLPQVRMQEGIVHDAVPELFASHDVYVNLGASGMYDKTIFEAAASGCLVIAASEDYKDAMGDDFHIAAINPASVAERLEATLSLSEEDRISARARLQEYARRNSLARLAQELELAMR
jgi:glycosyltransferase involved in cell wall biosynthesis